MNLVLKVLSYSLAYLLLFYGIVFLIASFTTPTTASLMKSNINKLSILLGFISISSFVIDLTEFSFELTSKVLFIHNFPDLYGTIPTSLAESIFAIGYSVVVCMILPCIISVVFALIMSLCGCAVKSFSNKLAGIWVIVTACIWSFVLLNGLGVLTQYEYDPFIGHDLIYTAYFATFILTYILVPIVESCKQNILPSSSLN